MEAPLRYSFKGEISTNHIGIEHILGFYFYAQQYRYKRIVLCLLNVTHIDANLSALLLAIIDRLRSGNKLYIYVDIPKELNILYRNGFYNQLFPEPRDTTDERESTIVLKKISPAEDDNFCEYVAKDFFSHRGLAGLPLNKKNGLKDNFNEIFVNVGEHAETESPVYVCGQYFPEKKQLKFTLVDLGVGFLAKIKQYTNGNVSTDIKAIEWAIEGNTTKTMGVGGVGLKGIRNYCINNSASLHICSGKGYLNCANRNITTATIKHNFQGVIVNMIFRDI